MLHPCASDASVAMRLVWPKNIAPRCPMPCPIRGSPVSTPIPHRHASNSPFLNHCACASSRSALMYFCCGGVVSSSLALRQLEHPPRWDLQQGTTTISQFLGSCGSCVNNEKLALFPRTYPQDLLLHPILYQHHQHFRRKHEDSCTCPSTVCGQVCVLHLHWGTPRCNS